MIEELLRARHKNDVFVTECNTGSATQGCRRMDAWAMRRTWSPITMVGYEVKRTRSDFIRDDKWPLYLPMCHQLYFVCPHEIIQLAEVPDGVGLIWTTKNGKRLYTKKKAPHRDIEIPARLLIYVLMSRSTIDKEAGRDGRMRMIEGFFADKRRRHELAGCVSQGIHNERRRALLAAHDSEMRINVLSNISDRMRELGFDPNAPVSEWRMIDKLREMSGETSTVVKDRIRRAVDALKLITYRLEQGTDDR